MWLCAPAQAHVVNMRGAETPSAGHTHPSLQAWLNQMSWYFSILPVTALTQWFYGCPSKNNLQFSPCPVAIRRRDPASDGAAVSPQKLWPADWWMWKPWCFITVHIQDRRGCKTYSCTFSDTDSKGLLWRADCITTSPSACVYFVGCTSLQSEH